MVTSALEAARARQQQREQGSIAMLPAEEHLEQTQKKRARKSRAVVVKRSKLRMLERAAARWSAMTHVLRRKYRLQFVEGVKDSDFYEPFPLDLHLDMIKSLNLALVRSLGK